MFMEKTLCVLSHFSFIQLLVTLWTVADQAPLSMETIKEFLSSTIFPKSLWGKSVLYLWIYLYWIFHINKTTQYLSKKKKKEYWSGLPFPWIFLTQGLNLVLPHCR